MKIKNISCTQFAGIRNKSLSLDDGINLIYGKNESGKSTLVNLMSRTLFQDARIDGRKDKEFKELYFPSTRKGKAAAGDFVDGKITFDTEKGSYTLEKEWEREGRGGRCILSAPNGEFHDSKNIEDTLKEVLPYGKGVYSDMLFPSQSNVNVSLQKILAESDVSEKTGAKKEIADAVTQAFAESDGITADTIEQEIKAKIDEIRGKHWDTDSGMPDRKPGGGRWLQEQGEILKAYYDLEKAKSEHDEIKDLEEKADIAIASFAEKEEEVRQAEADLDAFNKFKGRLDAREKYLRLKGDYEKLTKAQSEWPQLEKDLKNADDLNIEKENRELLDKYAKAKELTDKIRVLRNETDGKICPTEQEISDAGNTQKKMAALENKLRGMNLNASIRMLDGNRANITVLRTGQALDIADSMEITEAVKIEIPGVMEMQLSPADVNVPETEAAIAEQKEIARGIFSRYGTEESVDELRELKRKIDDNKEKITNYEDKLSDILGERDYDELESAAQVIDSDVREVESIDEDIFSLCGSSGIVQYIADKNAKIKNYKAEYDDTASLEAKVKSTEKDLKRAEESCEDIPEKYADISNPDNYLAELQENLRFKRDAREKALTSKVEAEKDRDVYKERLPYDDPEENQKDKERKFEETKELLKHWLHIQQVFEEIKQDVKDNPLQKLSDSFIRYLGIISDGRISSEFEDSGKLNMSIYSGDTLVDYDKLSEGTKETVSLAFRLAVLDQLFPDGGGVIVFDDPFTDMDAERTKQSCRLIKECAARHQVIFLTCKEEYADMFGVKEIGMD